MHSGRVRSRTDSGLRQEVAPARVGFTVNVCLAKSSRILLHVLLQQDGWVEELRAPGRGSIFWIVGTEDLEVSFLRLQCRLEPPSLTRAPPLHKPTLTSKRIPPPIG
jgi:hypothetical protein